MIISRVLAGETDSFEELVIDNQDKVYNLAFRITGSEEDARDAAQEAFIKAYNSLPGFRGDSRFSVWLYRLTKNVCIDILRKKKRRESFSLTAVSEDDSRAEIEIPDIRFNPESEYEKKEIREEISQALGKLPEEHRAILVLREVNGLSYTEIGQILEIEDGTVKSRLFRARKRLCALLTDSGNLFKALPSNKEKEG